MKNQVLFKFRMVLKALFLLLFLGIMTGCTKSSLTGDTGAINNNNNGNSASGTKEILIQGNAYSPATLTVNAGTTVTWTNKDAVDHTVTSDTKLFDSGNISSNGTFSYKFSTAGTYNYHCTIHQEMTGTVIVN